MAVYRFAAGVHILPKVLLSLLGRVLLPSWAFLVVLTYVEVEVGILVGNLNLVVHNSVVVIRVGVEQRVPMLQEMRFQLQMPMLQVVLVP